MPFKKIIKLYPVRVLIAANIGTIIWATIFGWNLGQVMALYWVQSMTIGLFAFRKLESLPLSVFAADMAGGSTMEISGQKITDPKDFKTKGNRFFLLHYSFMHLFYLIFIITVLGSPLALLSVIVPGIAFVGNHLYSFKKNWPHELGQVVSTTGIFWKPYLRIIPMHLLIVFGGHYFGFENINLWHLILFMSLKTISDVVTHIIEHEFYTIQKAEA
jgi:hypothetical protein